MAEYMKLSPEDRNDGMRLACQVRLTGDSEVLLDNPAPPSPWKSIPAEDLAPPPGVLPTLESHVYGLAIDVGTTHIRVALWDRKHGRRIASRTGANPQAAFGTDILNRLDAARLNPAHADEIAALARDAIRHAVHDMLARDVGEVTPMLARIGHVVVVGNSAMMALLTGHGAAALIDPATWRLGIDYQPVDRDGWRSKWGMPHAEILVPAAVAGFIGCDLLADCIAARLLRDPPGTLLLDIGTNTEIALWDGAVLHVTSVPGGPAFEGAGIHNGMPAETGAICRVQPAAAGGFACGVIGGGAARGLCGSGLVDGIAALVTAGVLKPSGRFAVSPGGEGYTLIPGNPRSTIAGPAVDAFQRAKAAVAAAQDELLRLAGMSVRDLKRLVVCGAFGRHLNVANAQQLGLLPLVDEDCVVELHADAALAGAEQSLLSDDPESLFTEVLAKTRGINLSMVCGYDDCFVSHLRLRPFSLPA
jgi:uncharacterized 2Fe-2S/4Fe-4S cluster protein (DUF4445 family)